MKRKTTKFAFLLLLLALLPIFTAQAQQNDLPDTAYINGLIGHPQSYNLSCESRSAVDWAAFFGVPISESEFLFNLPRSDNPDKGFVGDVNGRWGNVPPAAYGVHAEPVAQLLQEYGLSAVARRGLSWEDLRAEVGNGRPVIVWLIGNVWAGAAQTYSDTAGVQSTVAPYEHTMILLGYDPATVYLLDASTGQVAWHALSSFLSSWAVLGNMAVLVGDEDREGETAVVPIPPPANPDPIYVVQRGDTLLKIAARFDLPWQELAAFNNLSRPDLIYVGQTLRLPGATEPALLPTTPLPEAVPDTPQLPPAEVPAPTTATYTVQRGEYLMQIARQLGLDWQAVAQLNNLLPPAYVVYPQQVLRLPGVTAELPALVAAPPDQAAPATYVVQQGDTLFKIATRFSLEWPVLAQLNGLSYPYRIYAGQTLSLP